jgi:hypothetical protein
VGRGLASLEVLGVEPEPESNPPRRHDADSAGDFAGFFIALGFAVPAGLAIYAAVIVAILWQ